jgi:hypothetical protein
LYEESSTAILLSTDCELRLVRHPSQRRRRCNVVSTTRRMFSRSMENLPHVRWGLNRRNELQSSVAHTNYADNGAWHNAEPALTHDDRTDEDVEDAAAEEREHERGIACHLLGNLELE